MGWTDLEIQRVVISFQTGGRIWKKVALNKALIFLIKFFEQSIKVCCSYQDTSVNFNETFIADVFLSSLPTHVEFRKYSDPFTFFRFYVVNKFFNLCSILHNDNAKTEFSVSILVFSFSKNFAR